MSHRVTIAILLLSALAGPACGLALDPPSLAVVGSDRASVTLEVTAGASGAPGGFALEWLKLLDLQSRGDWPAWGAGNGTAEFTGVPTLNVTPGVASYQLGPGQAVRVVVGALFDETGTSETGGEELAAGTTYVFRACALADASGDVGPAGAAVTGATQPQGAFDCTVSWGFWRNHLESWSRVSSIQLGAVTYSRAQILAILGEPARGNGLVSLAHQLIAAKLNLMLGALPPAVIATSVPQADALIGSSVVPPVGDGWLSPEGTVELVDTFDLFNTGVLGPGHCLHPEGIVPVQGSSWGSLKALYR
jgi:hypothetical protein